MSNKSFNMEMDFRERLAEGLVLGVLTFVFVGCVGLMVVFRRRQFAFRRKTQFVAAVSGLMLLFAVWCAVDPFVDSMSLGSECSLFDANPTLLFHPVKVIMWFDGQVEGLRSEQHNKAFAASQNIAFERLCGCAPRNRAPQWGKVALLRLEMDTVAAATRWIVWIDSDAVFTNWRLSLRQLLDEVDKEVHLVVGGDLEHLQRPINTGFMAVRVGQEGRDLMDKIWRLGAKMGRKWRFGHEQEALTVLMHKDTIVKSQVLIWKDRVRLFSENDSTLVGNELILHAAGWPGVAKLKAPAIMIARTLY